jgi:hypothetical protein
MKHDDVELLPDVISLEDDGHDIGAEQRAYEMRRMWTPANRDALVSVCCRILLGVGGICFLEYYKTSYPQRHATQCAMYESSADA